MTTYHILIASAARAAHGRDSDATTPPEALIAAAGSCRADILYTAKHAAHSRATIYHYHFPYTMAEVYASHAAGMVTDDNIHTARRSSHKYKQAYIFEERYIDGATPQRGLSPEKFDVGGF